MSVYLAHYQVGNNHMETLQVKRLYSLFAVAGRGSFKSVKLQEVEQEITDDIVVIYDQYFGRVRLLYHVSSELLARSFIPWAGREWLTERCSSAG
jgi:hypothetical protein